VIGDPVAVLNAVFRDWLPLIQRVGILARPDLESLARGEALYPTTKGGVA
jgi:hypothetical protein